MILPLFFPQQQNRFCSQALLYEKVSRPTRHFTAALVHEHQAWLQSFWVSKWVWIDDLGYNNASFYIIWSWMWRKTFYDLKKSFTIKKKTVLNLLPAATHEHSGNRNLTFGTIVRRPCTLKLQDAKKKYTPGWTKLFHVNHINGDLHIWTADCLVPTLFLLYFWPDNHSVPLRIKDNLHCFMFGIIFNISKSQWSERKAPPFWLLLDTMQNISLEHLSLQVCLHAHAGASLIPCLTLTLKTNKWVEWHLKENTFRENIYCPILLCNVSDLMSP